MHTLLTQVPKYLRIFLTLALRYSHRGRVTFLLQLKKVTRLILSGTKLNSCFLADPKCKTQDVFCNKPPLQSFRILLTLLTCIHVGNVAPKNGVPIEIALSSYCEKTRKKILKQFSQKTHDNKMIQWLVLGGAKIKKTKMKPSGKYFLSITNTFT